MHAILIHAGMEGPTARPTSLELPGPHSQLVISRMTNAAIPVFSTGRTRGSITTL